jgi:hypothetical protein
MTMTTQENPVSLAEGLKGLVGRRVSSVEFVQDYVQLRFDGPRLSAYVSPVVDLPAKRLRHDAPGYRDELCARIGRAVVLGEFRDGEGLWRRFDDGVVVEISVRDKDYTGPEALEFVDGPRRWVV